MINILYSMYRQRILVKTATLQNGHKTFCYQNGHNQNGHTAFGQNGHRGRITTKTATLHLVKTATEGGSLPKRPHCIWSKTTEGCSLPKRPHYSKMATETETPHMIPDSPDLNLTPLAAFFTFLRSAKNVKKQQEVSDLNQD